MTKLRFKFRNLTHLMIVLVILVAEAIPDSKNDRTFDSTSTTEDDELKEWFSAMIGISNEPVENADSGEIRQKMGVDRIRTPEYVQNLYDRMIEVEKDDQVLNGRRRRNLESVAPNFESVDSGPTTIQAVTRDPIPQNKMGTDNGYLLQFNVEKLWIPIQELRSAELVMAVDFGRMTGPPSSYSVLAYLVDPSVSMDNPHPRLFIGSGSMGQSDTFQTNFVKLNVTDAVVRSLTSGSRPIIMFEIFVARVGEILGGYGEVMNRDLGQQDVARLLHLRSHGAHQPVLVLYSAPTGSVQSEIEPPPSRRRFRRVARSVATQNGYSGCHLVGWRIDLAKLFKDQVLAPEGLYANFCSGPCRNPLLNGRWNATANAHLRSAYNVKWRSDQAKNGTEEPSNVPEPQCVPDAYSPITVLFKADRNFVTKRLDKVIANSCMCA